MGQGYAGVEEEFSLKPEYFESFMAKIFVNRFNTGSLPENRTTNILLAKTMIIQSKTPYACVEGMYFALLLKVADRYLTFQEDIYSPLLNMQRFSKEETNAKLLEIQDFKKRLREKMGDL